VLDKKNGITKIGGNPPENMELNKPTSVVLDGDNYLFIVDSGNHRIIGQGPDGFRCIIGCFTSINLLLHPQTMSFDSCGNIYVMDSPLLIQRIQKFLIYNTVCGKIFKIHFQHSLKSPTNLILIEYSKIYKYHLHIQ